MTRRDGARRHARRLEVEHDGLGGDDAAGSTARLAWYGTGGRTAYGTEHPMWTSTASSPATSRLGPARAAQPARRPAPALEPGRGRRAGRSSTSGRRPTCPTPGPHYRDPALIARLTRLVADGRRRALRPPRPRRRRAVGRFFTTSFPAAVWHSRRLRRRRPRCCCSCRPSPSAIWLATSDAALEASAPEASREAYWRATSRPTTRRRRPRSSPPRSPSTTSRWRSSPSPVGHPAVRADRATSWSTTAPTSAWRPGCSPPRASSRSSTG